MVAEALISGGIQLLGGLFAGRSARKAEQRARVNFLRSGIDTREAAVAGGFNPLTFLQATGGGAAANGGFTAAGQPAALASIELITGGLNDFGRVVSGAAAQEKKERDLAYDMAKLEFEKASAVGGSSVASGGFATAARAATERFFEPVTKYRGGAPPSRPGAKSEPRISVFAPNGKTLLVPSGIADRLGIKPWQNMAMGEYTELVGELRGEGEGLLDLALDVGGKGNVGENLTGGDFYTDPGMGNRPLPPPPTLKPKPNKFWTYFGHSFN